MKQAEANERLPEMVKQFSLPYWNLHPAPQAQMLACYHGIGLGPSKFEPSLSKVFLDPRRVKYDMVNFDS